MNTTVENLLHALHSNPADETAWLALADALEESGQLERAELTRLTRSARLLDVQNTSLRAGPEGAKVESRIQQLLSCGVLPCVPEITNSIGMRLALIPAGVFVMGSPQGEAERVDDEGPVHEIEITQPFYLSVAPVTQEQYQQVMGTNPSHFSATGHGKDKVHELDTRAFPVEQVSWENAQTFLEGLSALAQEKEKGRKYRLPTEAEWEYSCRGGATSYQIFHFGNSLSSKQANFDGNHPYGGAEKGPDLHRTCQVGSYQANAFGLFDMHGNVYEWCADWYDEGYYARSPREDPPGPSEGASRVFRGGSWRNFGRRCRSAYRRRLTPAIRAHYLGFRAALVPSSEHK